MTAPDDPFALGLQFHRAGDLDAAERLYRAALERDAGHADALHLLGVAASQRGRHEAALDLIGRALRVRPGDAGFLLNQGVALLGLGRSAEAADAFRRAVSARPDFAEGHNNLANVLHGLGQTEDALGHWRRAVDVRPDYAEAHRNLAVVLVEKGQPAQAIGHAQEAARLVPNSAASHIAHGDALATLGHHLLAADAYRAAARLRPADPDPRRRLSHALREAGHAEEALAEAQEALRLKPDDADAHNEAAAALGTMGRAGEAEAHARQALLLKPNDPEASHNLAVLLAARRQFGEASELFRRALRSRPDLRQASLSLCRALTRQGLFDEAEDALRAALCLSPGDSQLHAALGEVLAGQGFLGRAEAAFRTAINHDPGNAAAHSSLLMAMCMDPGVTPAALLAESRHWGERHGRVPALEPLPERDRTTVQPLRVGYVSQDLLGHVVIKFFGPVLMHHDRRALEAYCYADVLSPDAVTGHLRGLAAQWRVIHGMSDEEVARLVRQDGIDVLVDLAGHTGSRLGVFARRPAPVQVTWLGYPATTGLDAIRYRLTDSVADPEGGEPADTEELVRLPGCFCCFLPSADAPPVSPSPCLKNGFVTFGSTHKLAKLNDGVLDAWCRVLQAVPRSRLLVYRDALRGRAADALKEHLVARGQDLSRVEMRSRTAGGNHLEVYDEIDVLLDCWPWGGHATACEALWQGVPVLSLMGDRHAGRMVASVLASVGLPEWVAGTADDFVAKAAGFAAAGDGLASLREGLREAVRRSPLCDGTAFTRGLEAAYGRLGRGAGVAPTPPGS